MADLADLRNQLATTAANSETTTFAFGAGRVQLGFIPLAPNNAFLANIKTDGPYLLILPGEKLEDINGEELTLAPKRYRVPMQLWLGVERSEISDFKDIEKFVESITTDFRGQGNVWQATFSKPSISVKRNPVLIRYDVSIEIVGC